MNQIQIIKWYKMYKVQETKNIRANKPSIRLSDRFDQTLSAKLCSFGNSMKLLVLD